MSLKVVVLLQEDRFVIPKNVMKILAAGHKIQMLVVADTTGSLVNMKAKFIRWFGPLPFLKLGIAAVKEQCACNIKRQPELTGVGVLARKFGIPLVRTARINDSQLVAKIESLRPDLIVSFSAPQIIREPLLSLPRLGCVNLHCSLLPNYRGLLPSFWVLLHNERFTGATVHTMGADIDDGAIYGQTKVELQGIRTIYDVIRKTKEAGGELLVRVMDDLEAGRITPSENRINEGSYFSWPTVAQAREFRAKGFRLI